MVPVELVEASTMPLVRNPQKSLLRLVVRHQLRTPMLVDVRRDASDDARNPLEIVPDVGRRCGDRFLHVQLPCLIKNIREVHTNSRKFVMPFFLKPEAQPCPRGDETSVPEHIEALSRSPIG